MAEARLAVAFQFQVTDEGEIKVHLDRRILVDVYRSIARVIKRKLFKSRNAAIQVKCQVAWRSEMMKWSDFNKSFLRVNNVKLLMVVRCPTS